MKSHFSDNGPTVVHEPCVILEWIIYVNVPTTINTKQFTEVTKNSKTRLLTTTPSCIAPMNYYYKSPFTLEISLFILLHILRRILDGDYNLKTKFISLYVTSYLLFFYLLRCDRQV